MMKKIAVLAGAGAMVLALVVPVLAKDEVKIDNRAKVYTKVYTKADTGDNSIHGKCVFGGKILTGDADAYALVLNDVNSSEVDADGDVEIDNRARVYTKVYTKADTGDNSIHGKIVGGGKIDTGDADATSIVTSFVNYSEVGL